MEKKKRCLITALLLPPIFRRNAKFCGKYRGKIIGIAETSGEHLGIFSRELLDKTERAQNATQLRACISQWHMAMQESRTGREKCLLWLNEVNELLHHGTALELKSA